MRIAYIGQKGIPAKIGGVERYVDEVATRMARNGHEVYVYVRSHYTPKKLKHYKGVNLVHLPTIKSKHLDAITHTFLCSVHSIFQNYDVVHYHSLGPTSLAFIPKLFAKRTAVIATYQSQDYYHSKWGWFAKKYLKFGEYMTLRIPDAVISVSKILHQIGVERYKRETVIIPNGVTLFKKAASIKIFNDWQLKKGKFILSVSRLEPHKEIHTLMQAFISLKLMKKIDQDLKLVIAGGSNSDDYLKQLKQLKRGRKDIILAGIQKGEKLAALYKNAYCFIQPSRTEGLSLALLEAMGMQLPIIVSDIPENVTAVDGNSLIFKTGDLFDLMNKIEYLTSNTKKAQELGEKAKIYAENTFDWNGIVKDIEQVYANTISEKITDWSVRKSNVGMARKAGRGAWLW